mmetsp:Transcript_45631/g.120672  ORF Transcript_45631/g.120672 Transcript_45631/m.120672 type:complete len:208 (+) Transcript_45631:916-1539(+)
MANEVLQHAPRRICAIPRKPLPQLRQRQRSTAVVIKNLKEVHHLLNTAKPVHQPAHIRKIAVGRQQLVLRDVTALVDVCLRYENFHLRQHPRHQHSLDLPLLRALLQRSRNALLHNHGRDEIHDRNRRHAQKSDEIPSVPGVVPDQRADNRGPTVYCGDLQQGEHGARKVAEVHLGQFLELGFPGGYVTHHSHSNNPEGIDDRQQNY